LFFKTKNPEKIIKKLKLKHHIHCLVKKMTNTIFIFCGLAGSGKDTSYNFFKKILQKRYPHYTIQNYAFGNSLKEIVSDVTELYTGERFPVSSMESLQYKEKPHYEHIILVEKQEQPLIIRALLQQIGTNILRKHLGDDIFADCVVKQIKQQFKHPNQIAIITDLRFPNEYKCVERYCDERNLKFYTIYIERDQKLTSHTHVSESFYDLLQKDFIIQNNGTLDDLYQKLEEINFSLEYQTFQIS